MTTPEECDALTARYNRCFHDWFETQFLEGKAKPDTTPCEEHFAAMKACLRQTIESEDLTDALREHNKGPPKRS